MEAKGRPKRRVLVVQPVLTHYRTSFFELVGRTTDLDIEIAAADGFMGIRSDPAFKRTLAPITVLPGKKAFWQSVDFSGLRRGDGVIFSGNVRFLNLIPDFIAARRRGLRVGWWGHWRSSGGFKTMAAVRRWLSSQADMVLAYSAAERNQAVAFGIAPSKAFVAPNTIDDRHIRNLVASEGLGEAASRPWQDGRPYFLTVGRLIPSKRVDLTIRAIATVRHAAAPGLAVIGDGPELPALRQLCASLDITDRVKFLGAITDDSELLPLFRGAVASVSAGPIGLAAPHSLAFHLPVIYVDTNNGPEEHFLVHGLNALRCSQTSEAIGSVMHSLLTDEQLVNHLKEGAARSGQRDVPIEKMVDGFLEACRYLVGGSAKA